MKNSRYFGRFMTPLNTRNKIITFQNNFYMSTIASILRGQRLPLSVFSQSTTLTTSVQCIDEAKSNGSLKELISLFLSLSSTSALFTTFKLMSLVSHLKGLLVQCLAMNKMNICRLIARKKD